tara:strand:+ start:488 stop:760 length:273 start_codon:yes stop_codon:yes gene_type:complete
MSVTALEAIGKVFTPEVMDIILKEGLVDYYDAVNSFQREERDKSKTSGGIGFPSLDYVHNYELLNALGIVVKDFMTESEYAKWLKERDND